MSCGDKPPPVRDVRLGIDARHERIDEHAPVHLYELLHGPPGEHGQRSARLPDRAAVPTNLELSAAAQRTAMSDGAAMSAAGTHGQRSAVPHGAAVSAAQRAPELSHRAALPADLELPTAGWRTDRKHADPDPVGGVPYAADYPVLVPAARTAAPAQRSAALSDRAAVPAESAASGGRLHDHLPANGVVPDDGMPHDRPSLHADVSADHFAGLPGARSASSCWRAAAGAQRAAPLPDGAAVSAYVELSAAAQRAAQLSDRAAVPAHLELPAERRSGCGVHRAQPILQHAAVPDDRVPQHRPLHAPLLAHGRHALHAPLSDHALGLADVRAAGLLVRTP